MANQITYEALVRLRADVSQLNNVGIALRRSLLSSKGDIASGLGDAIDNAVSKVKGISSLDAEFAKSFAGIERNAGTTFSDIQKQINTLREMPQGISQKGMLDTWKQVSELIRYAQQAQDKYIADARRVGETMVASQKQTSYKQAYDSSYQGLLKQQLQSTPANTKSGFLNKGLVSIGMSKPEHFLPDSVLQGVKRRADAIAKAMTTFTADPGKMAAQAAEAYQPIIDDLIKLASAALEGGDALGTLSAQMGENALATSEARGALTDSATTMKEQERVSRGTLLIMSKYAPLMNGVMMGVAGASGSLQGMLMSLMFTTTETFGLSLKIGLAVTGIGMLAKAAVGAVVGIVKLGIAIGTALVKAVVDATTAVIRFGVELGKDLFGKLKDGVMAAKDQVILLQDAMSMMGAGDLSGAEANARKYSRTTTETANAMMILRKNQIPMNQGLEATAALAARNNTTMDAAAQSLAGAIGTTRENVVSLRDQGVVLDEVAKGTDRATVMNMVLSGTLDQLGGKTEAYANTSTASLNRLQNAQESVRNAFAVPIWDKLLIPLADLAAPALDALAGKVSALFSGIDFGAIINGFTTLSNTISPLFGKIFDGLTKAMPNISTMLAGIGPYISQELGKINWDTILPKVQALVTNISGVLLGVVTAVIDIGGRILNAIAPTISAIEEAATTSGTTTEGVAESVAGTIVYWAIWVQETVLGIIKVISGSITGLKGLLGSIVPAALVGGGMGAATAGPAGLIAGLAGGGLIGLVAGAETPEVQKSNDLTIEGQQQLEAAKATADAARRSLLGLSKTLVPVGTEFYEMGGRGRSAVDALTEGVRILGDQVNTLGGSMAIPPSIMPEQLLGQIPPAATAAAAAVLDTGNAFNYLGDSSGAATDKVAQELKALVDGWEGLVEGVLKPTMDFDYTGWMDNMTTAYDKMGQGSQAAASGIGHTDTWDEPFRRVMDVVNRGMDSPWAKTDFAPPPEVLAKGNDAVKAWAAGIANEFQLGMRPDMINWGDKDTGSGFLGALQQQITSKSNWEAINEEAKARAEAAGLDVTNAMVQSALGITLSPEAAKSLQIATVVRDAFQAQVTEDKYATILLSAIVADMTANETLFGNNGGSIANYTAAGFITAVNDLAPSVREAILSKWVVTLTGDDDTPPPPPTNGDEIPPDGTV